MFIDHTTVEVSAGNGGKGMVSFRREKYIPKGGPNGGDGGRGGHIFFRASKHLHTLQDIRYKKFYRAGNGGPGGSNQKTGKNGQDIYIEVPLGTLIKNKPTGMIVADLVASEQEYRACLGGIGGRGNARYKSSTNQAPRKAQPGKIGEKGIFELELKVLADVGLVGQPNAGKSTFLSTVTSARPKIADYPFTTLQPHLGIVKAGDYKSFVMADIPGLIEGASRGKGLGHKFLRHVERNRLLLYMIDVTEQEPARIFESLKGEILEFNPDLILKPYLVVRTKTDLVTDESMEAPWENFPVDYLDLSSRTGSGIKKLIQTIVTILDAGE